MEKPLLIAKSLPADKGASVDSFYLRAEPCPDGLAPWADPARPTSWDYPARMTSSQRREAQRLAGVLCLLDGQDPGALLDQERFDDSGRPGVFATSWICGALIQKQDLYLGRAAAALAEAERAGERV